MKAPPQGGSHDEGWGVRNLGRFTIEYREGRRVALIEVDRGSRDNVLYPDTLSWVEPTQAPPTAEERAVVVPRIVSAVPVMDG